MKYKPNNQPASLVRSGIVITSMLLFAASISGVAFYCANGEGILGLVALLGGWTAILFGVVAWFANPFLFCSWFLILDRKKQPTHLISGIGCAVVALVLSVSALLNIDTAVYWRMPTKPGTKLRCMDMGIGSGFSVSRLSQLALQ